MTAMTAIVAGMNAERGECDRDRAAELLRRREASGARTGIIRPAP